MFKVIHYDESNLWRSSGIARDFAFWPFGRSRRCAALLNQLNANLCRSLCIFRLSNYRTTVIFDMRKLPTVSCKRKLGCWKSLRKFQSVVSTTQASRFHSLEDFSIVEWAVRRKGCVQSIKEDILYDSSWNLGQDVVHNNFQWSVRFLVNNSCFLLRFLDYRGVMSNVMVVLTYCVATLNFSLEVWSRTK